ncbi:MAG: ATP-binding domain-containing protein [Nitrospirae bacterium]|nr:ATP-binding domain-containing protein [Magnetococcales bacterium]
MNNLNFVHGFNGKPAATQRLEKILGSITGLSGECFFGYPLIATPEGKYSIDATLVSPEKGVVLFDLIEGTHIGDYASLQDDLFNKFDPKLRVHKELVKGRQLIPGIQVVTFAPAINNITGYAQNNYLLTNETTLDQVLRGITWDTFTQDLYRRTLSAVESLSSIRKSRSKREVKRTDSRGAKLKKLEDSIATLDHRQNRAVIETIDGVQRIRGLAGSGKTIILALKAAYLHAQHPDWRIAVTFNTRSLKGQFKRLIETFCIENGVEPDWTRVRVVNAWGAPGDDERDGLYYEFCRTSGQDFYDFGSASRRFNGNDKAFDGACQFALSAMVEPPQLYDAILVDEAQDFSPSFLRLCHALLKQPKRLVYAYDELQNLSGTSLPSPENIFGNDSAGRPIVTFDNDPRRGRDIILEKCYRNSRPVLVTAHALGFGIYREPPNNTDIGLVQMFDHPDLWREIGYQVCQGDLVKGQHLVLERTDETSPRFLEEHSSMDDLVTFQHFESEEEQNTWLVEQIKKNLTDDELRHDDIIVIHPDPPSARSRLGPIRKILFDENIQSHLAGVDTDADVFFKTNTQSITFTGIYRAKGNEAGMVYVVNAQVCGGSGTDLAGLRNCLFTAVTRSKAWVRIIGYGRGMKNLMDEFQTVKQHDFRLDFTYPTDRQLEKMRVVHRDFSPAEKAQHEQRIKTLDQSIKDLDPRTIAEVFQKSDPDKRQEVLRVLNQST